MRMIGEGIAHDIATNQGSSWFAHEVDTTYEDKAAAPRTGLPSETSETISPSIPSGPSENISPSTLPTPAPPPEARPTQ